MQIIIDTANTSISVRNGCFYIENQTDQKQISPTRISSIAITAHCQINTAAIKLAAHQKIPILFFNDFGTIQARLESPYFLNTAQLRKKQLLFSMSHQATTYIGELLVRKTTNQISTLKWLAQHKKQQADSIKDAMAQIQTIASIFAQIQPQPISAIRPTILGTEGSISRIYFEALSQTMPPLFTFEGRTRRPALDFFNAGLNYLYGMTYGVVESGIFAKGLDPMIGIFHTDQYAEPTLAFDLIEPLRPVIDKIWLEIIFKNLLTEKDFVKKEQGYWINKEGKRLIIRSFNEYIHQRVSYNNKVMRFKDHIYQEANALGNYLDENVTLP